MAASVPDIIAAIERAYGSLQEPNWSFVLPTWESRPYAALLARIEKKFDVEDTMDVNYDVSFRYLVERHGKAWGLDLSMAGPYALLMRVSDGRPAEVITGDEPGRSRAESKLLALIADAGVTLLSREVLEREIPFRREPDEGEPSRIYHALIADDSLPWEAVPVGPLEALQGLSHELGLRYEPQDWGIINADESRLSEFIDFLLTADLMPSQRFDLVELILASANERLLVDPEADLEPVANVLRRLADVAPVHVDYWRSLHEPDEFPLGVWLRKRESG